MYIAGGMTMKQNRNFLPFSLQPITHDSYKHNNLHAYVQSYSCMLGLGKYEDACLTIRIS